MLDSVAVCRAVGRHRATEKGGKRTCQQRAKVLITYRSNLADDSLKRRRAAQRAAQKEREETIYCSKVPWSLISASLNVYYQFPASEPCLAALTTTSLSLPNSLTPLFSLFYSRSTLPAFILSFTSHLCPLTSHFLSPLSIPPLSPETSVNQRLHQCSLHFSICVLNLNLVFILVALLHPSYSFFYLVTLVLLSCTN